ncbi:trimeric intracellular cation channel family protein [Curtobacterium pusillum]|uniref:Trimeric intracellular cation channel family protein n=1 Tax=Curtobacterium pusillum TaxID=69373 RepID=A0ABX2M2Y5_9MICO|nr:trimeric intracellular cation channel family protein [Curtobacterium pusillum]NUU12510.1 trimeric intracellular cation channel family protein [Curtobacterium pusillum]GLK33021.1 UPF0126 membrane protein [Curtobacterium pusillum]
MDSEPLIITVLNIAGTFAFGLNGALTAMRFARLDIVGVLVLGMLTALGGGTIRDVLLDRLPPATFRDWRYLAAAAAGALVAFALGHALERVNRSVIIADAVGLAVFAATGAATAMQADVGVVQSVILGTVTAVGGGTIRDVLVRQVPSVLSSGFYAIPAAVGAAITATCFAIGLHDWIWVSAAALACFALRVFGVRYQFRAPRPPKAPDVSS